MNRALKSAGLRPFSPTGYEILDGDLDRRGVAAIWSVDPRAPAVGETFTLDRAGGVVDLEVIELATFKGGGWSATCRRLG